MQVADFDYELPTELIAQTPLARREGSRLLVIDRRGGTIEHRRFTDLPRYLRPGDLLVLNDTKVRPARLLGQRANGGMAEVLLLHQLDEHRWEALVRPGRRLRVGAEISFGDGVLRGTVVDITPGGERIIEFAYQGVFQELLAQLGEVPLPPYIREKLADPQRYQTVYAREEGSAAAPTAGLHFTPEMLEEIRGCGIGTAFITLHVGIGTFRPVKTERIEEHQMHREYYRVGEETAAKVAQTRRAGGRIVAVGTTVARTLETVGREDGTIGSGSGWTDIFIYPGYRWRVVDGLLTNFHLPRSTLLMLVSALAGRELIMEAYRVAVEERYRFFSFGDACLIL
ncbi:MAG: tRNA preQ1(34) S-adenosylmethionine ribosyltransferase-isomerase QueA [Limnochordia bacterium]